MNVGTLGSRAADAPPAAIAVGTRIRVERDETRYPSRGTWPQFRGKTGTVVEINRDRKRPHLTEYGVSFGKTRTRPDGSLHGDDTVTWFKVYEMAALASQRPVASPQSTSVGGSGRKGLSPHSDRTLEAKELIHVQV
jgi:hypothetical protein